MCGGNKEGTGQELYWWQHITSDPAMDGTERRRCISPWTHGRETLANNDLTPGAIMLSAASIHNGRLIRNLQLVIERTVSKLL